MKISRSLKTALFAGSALLTTTLVTPATAYVAGSHAHQTQPAFIHTISITKADETKAQNFITNLAKKGVNFLEDGSQTKEEKEEAFQKLLRENFDMKTIGRFSLGKYWRDASKEQQEEYLTLFENMIVDVYSRRFGEYDGQELKITDTEPVGKRDILVSSQIIQSSGPNISVAWRVRNGKTGAMKIVDISVEGVSMSLTQRADFSSVIQRGGGKIEALLEHLR